MLVSIGVLKLVEISASSSLSSLASSAEIPLNDTNKNKSTSDIPHIYPTRPNGEIYRFNNTHLDDLNQVNETEDPTVFSHKN